MISSRKGGVKETSQDDTFYLNFDGLCEPKNPGGIAAYGIVIHKGRTKILEEGGEAFAKPWSAEASNNVAEYSALIKGLEWLRAKEFIDSRIIVRGDSSLVVNQLNGKFKIKALRIVELYNRAKNLVEGFDNIRIEWVERSLNKEADLQSRIAYAKLKKKYPI